MKTKLTEQQFQHYLKGGKFLASYLPKSLLSEANANAPVNKKILVYQNMLISPSMAGKFIGQHMFNSPEVYGYFPEEDIEDLEIVNEFLDSPEPYPIYMYLLYYNTKEQVQENFGNYKPSSYPVIVERSFPREMDDYIISISTDGFQASKIQKAVWHGNYNETLEFVDILTT